MDCREPASLLMLDFIARTNPAGKDAWQYLATGISWLNFKSRNAGGGEGP